VIEGPQQVQARGVAAEDEHDRVAVEGSRAGADVVEQRQREAALGQVAQDDRLWDERGSELVDRLERARDRRLVAVGRQLVGQERGGGLVGVDEQDGVRHAESP
jgi:hypothetical protein